jgi:glycolate oxidase
VENSTKNDLRNIVGENNFTESLIDLIAFSRDASEYKYRPEAAVWVTTAEQVSQILKLANRENFSVTPRGAGTGLAGLAVPRKGGLILDMGRMDRIMDINIEDRLAVVQPGVVYAGLQEALAPYNFFFPPDPASGAVSTLGGNVATNAGGMKGAKYGTTKDYVLALEVVLPDGQILNSGSKCMKSVSGYDLTRLFVGSEGTLGVITEITLKINPKPSLSRTAMALFLEVEAAGRAVSEIMYSGILPSALEVLNKEMILALKMNTDLELPEAEAMLMAETDGYTLEEAEFQLERIVAVFKKNQAFDIRQASSQEEADSLWMARKFAGPVVTRINTHLAAEDLSIPMSKVPEMLKTISALSRKYDLQIPTLGHAGDGNLHPVIIFDGTNPEETQRVEQAATELFQRVVEMGGTVTGEHGIGLAKAPFMTLEHDEVAMKVMRSLKHLFDPNNILNPGKMSLDI